MRISILFHFVDESKPVAVTTVEGDVTDVVLPGVRDTICHNDRAGQRFRAVVTGRHFDYRLANGAGVDGTITVTLSLERLQTQ